MPDVHLSEEVCTGTVIATKRLLYPHAVGNDIGCGMAAVRLQGEAACLAFVDDTFARFVDDSD